METTTTEESRESEAASESSESMTLNGEAWKNRDNTTYTSLLDRYEAVDLFSNRSMNLYQEQEEQKHIKQEEMTAYIFSGQMQTQSPEENMVELIFSEEIQLSKVRDYSKKADDYSIYFILMEILFVLVFIYILMKINAGRKKRREENAVKIDMEN